MAETTTDLAALEARIEAAILEARNDGWHIRPGKTRNEEERCCCALGAVVITEGIAATNFCEAGCAIGLTVEESIALVAGFDEAGQTQWGESPVNAYPDLFSLGKSLRAKYVEASS